MIDFFIPLAHAAEAVAAAEVESGILGKLGIDLKLFIAQLINFAIVLLVLWKWVFIPVSKKLQERTDKIEKSLNDAERITREKQEFENWRQQELTKARQEASSIVTTAQADAVKAKDQILQQTKEDQQKLIEQAKMHIEQEKTAQLQSAKNELADLVTNATEKILRSKLDPKKDAELIKESLKSI